MPKISVVVPFFNSAEHIAECIESIAEQSLADIEIICVDDGSTDGSRLIVESAAEKDRRIRLVKQQENLGAASARNKGLDVAKGEFVCFMDSDDYYPDTKVLEDLYETAVFTSSVICGGSLAELHGNLVKKEFSGTQSGYSFQAAGRLVYSEYQFDYGFTRFIYSRRFLKENNVSFPEYKLFEDPPFFVKAMALAGSIQVLPRISYVYRVGHHEHNWTKDTITDLANGLADVLSIAVEHQYWILAETEISRISQSYLPLFCRMLNTDDATFADAVSRLSKLADTCSMNLGDSALFVSKTLRKLVKYHSDLFEARGVDDATEEPDPGCPEVSIVIPVYNVEKYINACVKSAANQTERNIEIILVNDGTQDCSIDEIEDLVSNDDRISLLNKDNGGLSSARNHGLLHAKGEFVLFLDSDDFLACDAVEKLTAKARKENLDQLFFGAESFYESYGSYRSNQSYTTYYQYSGKYPEALDGKTFLELAIGQADFKPSACLQLLRRKFLVDNSLSFMEGILHEDNLFTLSCLLLSERTGLLNEPLYRRRVRSDSIMTSGKGVKNAFGYYCTVLGVLQLAERRGIELSLDQRTIVERQLNAYLANASRFYHSDSAENIESFCAGLSFSNAFFFKHCLCGSLAQNPNGDVGRYEKALEKARKAEADLRQSNSFRIGRAVTFLPRKVKKILRKVEKLAKA